MGIEICKQLTHLCADRMAIRDFPITYMISLRLIQGMQELIDKFPGGFEAWKTSSSDASES